MLAWIELRLAEVKEACIGLIFVLAASGGILLMSRDVHSGEHLKDLLVGQILWVNTNQLIVNRLADCRVLALWHWSRLKTRNLGFYGLFALAVTASVQLVGVYLVFASLIVPALATYRIGQLAHGLCFCDRHHRICNRAPDVRMARFAQRRNGGVGDGNMRRGGHDLEAVIIRHTLLTRSGQA